MGKAEAFPIFFVVSIKKGELLVTHLYVGLPRFELGQAEPKSAVLPLHHKTIVVFSAAKIKNFFISQFNFFQFFEVGAFI